MLAHVSTLSSTSTYSDIVAAYEDNASYFEDGSVAKCKAFITACTFLLRRTPRAHRQGSVQTDYAPELLNREIAEAKQWLSSNQTVANGGGGVRGFSVENFR